MHFDFFVYEIGHYQDVCFFCVWFCHWSMSLEFSGFFWRDLRLSVCLSQAFQHLGWSWLPLSHGSRGQQLKTMPQEWYLLFSGWTGFTLTAELLFITDRGKVSCWLICAVSDNADAFGSPSAADEASMAWTLAIARSIITEYMAWTGVDFCSTSKISGSLHRDQVVSWDKSSLSAENNRRVTSVLQEQRAMECSQSVPVWVTKLLFHRSEGVISNQLISQPWLSIQIDKHQLDAGIFSLGENHLFRNLSCESKLKKLPFNFPHVHVIRFQNVSFWNPQVTRKLQWATIIYTVTKMKATLWIYTLSISNLNFPFEWLRSQMSRMGLCLVPVCQMFTPVDFGTLHLCG